MRLSVAVVISLLGWLWVGVDTGLVSSFLPLMEEKKIKASGTPAKLAEYIIYYWGESSFVFSFSFS